MKELRITIAFACLLFAGKMLAQEYTFEPYAGVGYQYQQLSLKKGFGRNEFKKKLHGMNFVLGAKVHQALEFEVGTHFSHTAKKINSSVKSFSTFVRAIGLVPVAEKLDLMIGMGMSVMNLDYKLKNLTATSIRQPVPHLILGTKLKMNDWLAVRAMGSFEGTKHKSHPTIKTNHSHALHGGLVGYF
jgi:hypothetical protein